MQRVQLLAAICMNIVFFSFCGSVERAFLEKQRVTATDKGQTKEVLSLFKKGADVNAKDEDATTALMFATREGHALGKSV